MNKQRYIDLHVHSTASDGTCTPTDDVKLALDAGLAAFAITDHDTVAGYEEAKNVLEEEKRKKPDIDMELVPGVEISGAFNGRDIHILGLYINPFNQPLNEALAAAKTEREARSFKIMERFAKYGISFTEDELKCGEKDTVITRAHFARALVQKGIVKDKKEAFDKYLGYECPCYIPRAYIEPEKVISLILAAGGIPVLAHPFLYEVDRKVIFELLEKRLVPAGLKGLEVMHSTNKDEDTDVLRSMASHFGLMMTGGSDFHGKNKPDINLGTGRGNLRVPECYLETLRRYKNENGL